MSFFDGLRHRVNVLLRGEAYAREIERELRFHLELDALAAVATGAAQQEMEIEARRRFGSVTYYREEVRRMTPMLWLDSIRQDLAYAWRGLRRSPGFTITVVLTLGLGLGVNAAMFSLLDRVFLQPPRGVATPSEIRRLYIDVSRPNEPGGRMAHDSFNYPYFFAVTGAQDTSLAFAAFTAPDSTALVQGDSRIPVRRSRVTGRYFSLLGVRPQLGRFFTAEEARIEAPTPVVVLSDALWRREYRGDVTILGRTISLNTVPYTVIGVAPTNFTGVDINAVDVWLPANTYPSSSRSKRPWYETFSSSFRLIARLPTPGTEEQVLSVGTRALRTVHLEGFVYDSTATVRSGPIAQAMGPAKRQQELAMSTRLAGFSFLVLLIACANVANLLLVRATGRRREIAVRRALGVSGMRLYEQLLTESLLLATLGGIVAIAFAFWAGSALRHLLLPNVQWASGAIDLRVIAFIGVATLLAGISAGLAPALHATKPDLIGSLKAGSRDTAYQRSTLRSGLLAAQAALSVVLIVGAGLFLKSLNNVVSIDLGYEVDNAVFIRPSFSTPGHEKEVATGLPGIADRLRSVPGVEAVAYTSAPPMQGYGFGPFLLPDRDSLPRFGTERGASYVQVSPGYFRAAGVRLIAGREFAVDDRTEGARPVVVSQAMARTYWPGENALGKCVILGKRGDPCSSVVGVVADVHRMTVIEQPIMQYYIPLTAPSDFGGAADIVVRVRGNPTSVVQLAGQELKRAFPSMTVPAIRTMAKVLEPQFRPWRLAATLFSALGILALVVAVIGVYSVVAYAATQRTHEMGIRLALGARAFDILDLVASEGLRMVGIGVIVGVVAALALGRLVSSLLFGVTPSDPSIIIGSAAVLCAIGLVASIVPGWRAARIDPVIALRTD